jgi:peptidyl-prolyl cis-trans isomerase A (cyclophilin A)
MIFSPRLSLLPFFATLAVLAGACGDRTAQSSDTAVAATAPDSFRVAFETSRGTFVVEAHRAWAPNGADRFYQLVRAGFFDDTRFFRVVPEFIAQFGINDKKKVNERWEKLKLADDPPRETNARGTITFTNSGPGSRSHQMFVSLADNPRLDKAGFVPVGRVIEGMAVVDSIYSGYGEAPEQSFIQTLGNSYLTRMFPKLDYVRTARVLP